MQWQEHTKCSNPSLPNFTKATKAYGGIRRKNNGGNHKEIQDLDPIGFPHKEEKVIGGNVDLDLLSLFPQKDSRIMGGMKEGGQALKVNNGGERNPKRVCLKEEEGVFIGGWKSGRWKNLDWVFWP